MGNKIGNAQSRSILYLVNEDIDPLEYYRRNRSSEPSADEPVQKQKRTYYPRRNPKATTWYINYCTAGNTFSQEGHRDRLFFRQRFRVPYAKYKEMVDECRTVGWWKERPDANGRPGAHIDKLTLRNVFVHIEATVYRAKEQD